MPTLLVTGANGHLGRRLLATAAASWTTRAIVRSERAAAQIADHPDVRIVDYGDIAGLTDACANCDAIVHLVGIIKEGGGATYRSAHVEATQALLEGATNAAAKRIVYLSILGAEQGSRNRCLASKAEAEALLARGRIPSLVLRVPMVLGEGDYAAASLLENARKRTALTFRGASMEQPIYAGDVVDAVLAGLAADAPTGVLELAGPQALPRSDLIAVASAVGTRTVSLPLALGYGVAALFEALSNNPPLTADMLGVLDHDDDIDPEPAANALGIRLTGLTETLARIALPLPPKGTQRS